MLLGYRVKEHHFLSQSLGGSLVEVFTVVVGSELVEKEPCLVAGIGNKLCPESLVVVIAPVCLADKYRTVKLLAGLYGVVNAVSLAAEVGVDDALCGELAGLGIDLLGEYVEDIIFKSFKQYLLRHEHTVFLTSDGVLDADTVFDVFEFVS